MIRNALQRILAPTRLDRYYSTVLSPLNWVDLEKIASYKRDYVNGPTNSQSNLRLFGEAEENVEVTLYRDFHSWCPYCQRVWLWLEEKRIPYRVERVSMFCYAEKEQWYKDLVPTGELPALSLNGSLISDSNSILLSLERKYGPLYKEIASEEVKPLLEIERDLFKAWCRWIASKTKLEKTENLNKKRYTDLVKRVEEALGYHKGPYFLEEFSTVDCIYTPFLERMNASLFYYKGYSLREENPRISQWFDAMETREAYRGTQSDFHTHVHALPPQMGSAYTNNTEQAAINQQIVNHGDWFSLPDIKAPEPAFAKEEALHRVLKHKQGILDSIPTGKSSFEEALRCALTLMMTNNECLPPKGSEVALRHLRDRINVPRDMSIYAAKHLRTALEQTASLVSKQQPDCIPTKSRNDQNPYSFSTRSIKNFPREV